jgi:ornithine--oxo-acid transaminase
MQRITKSIINHQRCSRFLFTQQKQQQHRYFEKLSSQEVINLENKYSAHNYHPLPIVYEKAQGAEVWDPEGNKYFDFLSAYSAVNQGHRHPKILQAMRDQMENVTLSSRAFYNSVFGQWAKHVTELFGYEKVLPMNTGAEAVETAIKLSRKWGYKVKGIPENEALFIACSENFHGRTIAVISMSTDPDSYANYGPFLPGFRIVEYNDVDSLRKVLEKEGDKVCGFLVEPIQGEAGVVVPSDGYLKQCYDLCKKHNVLFIADEIQTGVGRTGKMMAHEWDGFKADVVLLAKAISGGVYPVSAVLASQQVMDVFEPGTHGSTYGGNPLGCAVSMAALNVVVEEKLCENSIAMGELFRSELSKLIKPGSIVTTIRGKGLLNAIVVNEDHEKLKSKNLSGYGICKILKSKGLLAKQTHGNIIRFTPPLVINEQQMKECLKIIKDTIIELENN